MSIDLRDEKNIVVQNCIKYVNNENTESIHLTVYDNLFNDIEEKIRELIDYRREEYKNNIEDLVNRVDEMFDKVFEYKYLMEYSNYPLFYEGQTREIEVDEETGVTRLVSSFIYKNENKPESKHGETKEDVINHCIAYYKDENCSDSIQYNKKLYFLETLVKNDVDLMRMREYYNEKELREDIEDSFNTHKEYSIADMLYGDMEEYKDGEEKVKM